MNQILSDEQKPQRSAGPSAGRILAGLVAGAVAGVAANIVWGGSAGLERLVRYVTDLADQLWLRALIMIVVPLVFASLTLGVAGLGDLRRLGRFGLKTLLDIPHSDTPGG